MKVWHYILVFLAAFVAYMNTLNHGFVLDDKAIITQNEFTQKGFSGIGDHFAHSYWFGMNGKDQGNYRPLSGASFSIEKGLFGNNPLPFHFLNVLFYAILCVLLLKLLAQLAFFKPIWALLAVLLFAVHPLHTEVVANIKSRDEIYAFLFVALSLIVFVKSLREGSKAFLILSGVLYLASLLSKETTLALLPVFVLISYFETKGIKTAFVSSSTFIVVAILYLAMYLGITDILLEAEYHLFDNSLTQETGAGALLMTKVSIIGRYIWLLFVPYPLRYDYSFNTIPIADFGDLYFYGGLLSILGLVVALVLFFKNSQNESWQKSILFLAIAILPLIPVSNFLFLIGSTMAERFMFIPSFGMICMIVFFLENKTSEQLKPYIPAAIGGVLIMLLMSITYSRNEAWKSDESLFAEDLKVLPNNAKAHHNLANIYETLGNSSKDEAQRRTYFEGAIALLETAEGIFPVPEFYKQLGGLYGNVQRWDGAIKSLKMYLDYFPNDVAVLNQLGMAYGISGDLESAKTTFERSYSINPNDVNVCINLGKTYGMLGDYENSLKVLEKAVTIDPKNTEAVEAYQTTKGIVDGL